MAKSSKPRTGSITDQPIKNEYATPKWFEQPFSCAIIIWLVVLFIDNISNRQMPLWSINLLIALLAAYVSFRFIVKNISPIDMRILLSAANAALLFTSITGTNQSFNSLISSRKGLDKEESYINISASKKYAALLNIQFRSWLPNGELDIVKMENDSLRYQNYDLNVALQNANQQKLAILAYMFKSQKIDTSKDMESRLAFAEITNFRDSLFKTERSSDKAKLIPDFPIKAPDEPIKKKEK